MTVIAKLKVKSGQKKDLAAPCRSLVAPTRAETGCITYDLHRSHHGPGLFMFTGSWESRALWEDHMRAPHLTAFGETSGAVTETWDLSTGETV